MDNTLTELLDTKKQMFLLIDKKINELEHLFLMAHGTIRTQRAQYAWEGLVRDMQDVRYNATTIKDDADKTGRTN